MWRTWWGWLDAAAQKERQFDSTFFSLYTSDSLVYSGRWCGCSYLQVSRIQCEHISNFVKCLASHTVEMKSMFQVLLSVISADCSPGDLNSVVNTKSILMDRWYLIMDTGINCLWFSLNAVQSTFEYSSLENSSILCYPDTNRLLEIYQCIVITPVPRGNNALCLIGNEQDNWNTWHSSNQTIPIKRANFMIYHIRSVFHRLVFGGWEDPVYIHHSYTRPPHTDTQIHTRDKDANKHRKQEKTNTLVLCHSMTRNSPEISLANPKWHFTLE